jgi:hypothetical protein
MVGFDASVALAFWFPDVACSIDHAKERMDYLVEQLEAKRERILIPTPALTELLVRAGDAGPEFVNQLSKSSRFEIAAFDDMAAIEVALSIAAATGSGKKRGDGTSKETWAKVKFDHQIVGICKVRQVSVLYCDDPRLCNFASMCELRTVRLGDLPLPPKEPTLFDGLNEAAALGDGKGAVEEKPTLQLAAPPAEEK